jgi:hypothetical protein
MNRRINGTDVFTERKSKAIFLDIMEEAACESWFEFVID